MNDFEADDGEETADLGKVVDYLEEAGFKLPNTKEEKVLVINSHILRSEEGNDFRWVARILSDYKNMPFAFWRNSSQGVHSGFFFYRGASFKELSEYLKSEEFMGNVKSAEEYEEGFVNVLQKMMRFFSEFDPDMKYDHYKFGL